MQLVFVFAETGGLKGRRNHVANRLWGVAWTMIATVYK